MLFLPEIGLSLIALIFFVLSVTAPQHPKLHCFATVAAGIATALCGLCLHQEGTLFYDAYAVNLYSQSFKLAICLSAFLLLLVGGGFSGIKERYRAEYYLFFFLSLLGLVLAVSSMEFITLIVALEISSFTTYIMVALRRDDNKARGIFHNEAAIKYLLYGVVATGFTLFGLSYLFGLTGSTHMAEIATKMPTLLDTHIGSLAILLVCAAPLFKLALFPVHSWAPDVYEGAATETTAFVASIPKIAGAAILIRIATMAGESTAMITTALLGIVLISLFFGNFSALAQTEVKRLMGFSGIAHGGFILLGVLLFDEGGYRNAIYYTYAYVLMNLLFFGVLCQIKDAEGKIAVEDLRGLYQRSPLLAISLATALFAMAGIPPLMGFTGKFILLVDGLQAGYLITVILAAANTALALYYYLSMVRLCFCTPREEVQTIEVSSSNKLILGLLALSLLLLGILPGELLKFIEISLQTL